MYSTAQTFYVDPDALAQSPRAFLTSVDLWFRAVPKRTGNASGVTAPGVTVALAPVSGGIPDLSQVVALSVASLGYDSIPADGSLASESVRFTFPQPVPVTSGQSYALLVAPEDPGYVLWVARAGENLVGTSDTFPGPSGYQGQLFAASGSGTWVAQAGQGLKFGVQVASFTANTFSFELTPEDHEFLTYTDSSGTFQGGEPVFVQSANLAGTVKLVSGSNDVTGTGTSFTTEYQASGYGVFGGNSTTTYVREVVSIANDSFLTLGEALPVSNSSAFHYRSPVANVFSQNTEALLLRLVGSTANTTLRFEAGDVVVGSLSGATATVGSVDVVDVSTFRPDLMLYVPSTGQAQVTYAFAQATGNTYTVNTSLETSVLNTVETTPAYDALLLSRSLEVQNANGMFEGRKSAYLRVTCSVDRPNGSVYDTPYVFDEKIDLFAGSYVVNDDDTGETGPTGNAVSRHVTVPLSFTTGVGAEDLMVYSTVYRPPGTRVEAYARLHNSHDPFALDDKAWTKLSPVGNSDLQTSTSNSAYVEAQWEIPGVGDLAVTSTASGSVTVQSGNSVLVGHGSSFTTDLALGDLVRVRNGLFPSDAFVARVQSVTDDTHAVLDVATSNSSVVGDGFVVDVLRDTEGGFLNSQGNGVARYYDADGTPYDTYDSVQVKVLLLSGSSRTVPRLANLRVVGVSA